MRLVTYHLWQRKVLLVQRHFKIIGKIQRVGNGEHQQCQVMLSMDRFMEQQGPYAELFSFVKSKTTILAEAKSRENILNLFHLPLSQQAFDQLTQLQQDLQQLTLNDNNDH